MKIWNLAETHEAIRRIVGDDPDHVDLNSHSGDGCKYVEDGAPSCVVGVFLVNEVGIGIEAVRELDFASPSGSSVMFAEAELYSEGIVDHMDHEARTFLQEIQSHQDVGYAWSDALIRTEDTLNLS